jgi:hypothetical protein
MFRPSNCLGLPGVLVACILIGASTAIPASAGNPASTAQEIRDKLVSLEKGFPDNTSLREALEFLSDRYDVQFIINVRLFQEENAESPDKLKLQLPKVINVRLGTILPLLLAQVHAAYQIHPDYVEIVPIERTLPAAWKQRRDLAPTVQAEFTGRSLDEALRELAGASGINMVLDARAGEKAKTSITTSLNNVPVDTAVLILADMADMRPVALDNVLYVTSKENAEKLLAWQEKQKEMAINPE